MWAYNSVFYQIYPLGFCSAPHFNDFNPSNRIEKITSWIPQIKKVGANAVYLSPVFSSDTHGYDTRDYKTIDCRLGTNEDFKNVCRTLHENGIKVIIDAVFNHVGRGFWAFEDVLKNRESSPYKDWFFINFGGNSNYSDGFWYEGWEGHFELVKLNLYNQAVRDYLISCVKFWYDEFNIDGLRLDVAYSLNEDFLRQLRDFCRREISEEFFLLGEMLHGDYNRLVNENMLHSATNYECYKGLYSSFNSMNMFEIGFSLNRQFGPENWTLYKGKHMLSFCDNHDVGRIASVLVNQNHLPLIYALMFSMPGIPCIYYGSEWGEKAQKCGSDDWILRPSFDAPVSSPLTDIISKLSEIKKSSAALSYGDYRQVGITNRQLAFVRSCESQTVLFALNADEKPFTLGVSVNSDAVDLFTGEKTHIDNSVALNGYSFKILKLE